LIFAISLVVAVLAVVSVFVSISYVSDFRFWFAVAAYVALAIGTLVET
jgi:hypothetical protein